MYCNHNLSGKYSAMVDPLLSGLPGSGEPRDRRLHYTFCLVVYDGLAEGSQRHSTAVCVFVDLDQNIVQPITLVTLHSGISLQ